MDTVKQETKTSEQEVTQTQEIKPATSEQNEMRIEVTPQVAYNMKLLDFDKKIAEAEALVSNLKKEKIDFIYKTEMDILTQKHIQKQKEEIIRKKLEQEEK